MPHSILIVEDDLTFATMLKTWLGKKGFSVDTASSNARARKQLDAQPYDLVLSDLRLPDQDGIFLLSWMKEQKYNIPLIIMTGYADIQSAVQAIKHGASDYISKPIQPDELLKKINEALQNKALPTPVGIEKNTVAPKASKNKAVPHSATVPPSNFLEGESEAARQLYNYVGLVAPTPMSVLINGASGTGKEYGAPYSSAKQTGRQAIHCHRLRFYPQRAGGFRIFRSCQRLLHRGVKRQNRSIRRSQRRYFVSG